MGRSWPKGTCTCQTVFRRVTNKTCKGTSADCPVLGVGNRREAPGPAAGLEMQESGLTPSCSIGARVWGVLEVPGGQEAHTCAGALQLA
jgi:hypothetical protein